MVRRTGLRHFASDEYGGAVIDLFLALSVFLCEMFSFIEFMIAVNQWTLAAKAAQVGGQLASTSDPVDSGLHSWNGLNGQCSGSPDPGTRIPAGCSFDSVCSGSSGT